MNETDLARVMRDRVHGEPVPVDRIVAGGLARGRRLRRRRATLRIATAGGALASVGAAAAVLVGTLGAHAAPQAPAGPAAQPSNTPVATHQFAVPADQTARTLAALLPAGSTRDLVNQSAGSPSSPPRTLSVDGAQPLHSIVSQASAAHRSGSLLFDDGHGSALIQLSVQAPDLRRTTSPSREDDSSALCQQPGVTCSTVNGGTLITEGPVPEYTGRHVPHGDPVMSSTAIYETDGWSTTVTAYNATAEKDGVVTRTNPPMSTGQLAAIATSPRWLR